MAVDPTNFPTLSQLNTFALCVADNNNAPSYWAVNLDRNLIGSQSLITLRIVATMSGGVGLDHHVMMTMNDVAASSYWSRCVRTYLSGTKIDAPALSDKGAYIGYAGFGAGAAKISTSFTIDTDMSWKNRILCHGASLCAHENAQGMGRPNEITTSEVGCQIINLSSSYALSRLEFAPLGATGQGKPTFFSVHVAVTGVAGYPRHA